MRKPTSICVSLLIAAVLGQLGGCALLQGMTGAQRPKMRFKTLHLRDMALDRVTLDFEFELENPNPVAVTFANLDYKLDIDGKQLLKGASAKSIQLKAQATSPLMVPFTIEFQQLAQSLIALFSAKDTVPYRLQAGFGIKTPIGVVTIPMDLSGKVPLPKLPQVKVAGVELKQLSPMGAALEFRLGITNRGSFPLKLQGVGYGVSIAGLSISEGTSAPTDVPAAQAATVAIPVSLNFLKLGMSVFNVVRSKQLPYNLSGQLDLGLFKQPFKLEGKAQL